MSEIIRHQRTKQRLSFEEHLIQAATEARAEAVALPPGRERDALIRKARQDDTAAHMNDWINSPGLKPPQ
jgi:hypothetical protein